MPQESPTRRGFKTVMLSDEAYGALQSFKERNGLISFSAAVLRALSEAQKPDPVPFDVESAILYCRLNGTKSAQLLREFVSDG